ncbi:MAG: hypothetical protein WCL23_03215 [Candidatus Moraniibacteriota bacterium]
MKKFFVVSASLLVVTLLFLGVYYFLFKNNPNDPTVDATLNAETKDATDQTFNDTQTQAPLEPVSETPVFGASIVGDNRIGFFRDGALRQFSFGGGGEEILIPDLPGKMLQVRWSPDKRKALTLLGNNNGQRWYFIDLDAKSIKPLKDGISGPAWSNLSEKIFYFFRDEKGRISINTAKPDGTEWSEIAVAPPVLNPFSQMIPGSTSLSFWSRPAAFEESSLYTVPVVGGTPEKIFGGKYGANFLWSPDGNKLLITNTIGKGGSDVRLGVANQKGGEFHTLQVPTLISKTVWSKDGKTVYYALPLSLPQNAVLPDDYFSKSLATTDSFWKLDTDTGKSSRVILPENISGNFDSIDLFLDPDENTLYFTNRTDNKLYRIHLIK